MRSKNRQDMGQIEIFGDSLVKLHKVLKEEDRLRASHKADKYGEEANLNPTIIIDFATITSIQEDYKNNGTVVMDKKTAVVVIEPLSDVLDAWMEVKDNLARQ
jgi:hypothetical protein